MSNHLTPTELAFETGLERQEVITTCMELGVPIFEGKIDKSLFAAARRESLRSLEPASSASSGGAGT